MSVSIIIRHHSQVVQAATLAQVIHVLDAVSRNILTTTPHTGRALQDGTNAGLRRDDDATGLVCGDQQLVTDF